MDLIWLCPSYLNIYIRYQYCKMFFIDFCILINNFGSIIIIFKIKTLFVHVFTRTCISSKQDFLQSSDACMRRFQNHLRIQDLVQLFYSSFSNHLCPAQPISDDCAASSSCAVVCICNYMHFCR